MDHRTIEERGVAEEYVLGRLAPAEEASFEEHLLACRACRERVAWAEQLQGSLRDMAAEDRERAAGLGLLAWLATRGRAARLGLAALLLLALALPAGLLIDEIRLRRSLAEARATSARERERVAAQAGGPLARQAAVPTAARPEVPGTTRQPQRSAGPAAAGPDRQALLSSAERERLAAQLRQRDADLARERRRADALREQLAELSRPQANAALFSLGLLRGETSGNRVVLGPRPAWIVLAIELPAPSDPAHPGSYRATLLDARGRTLWSGPGLRPTANDTLVLGLPSTLLAPGDHRLVLEGPGNPPEHTEIPFQVVGER
jgi:hypothetical protein